MIDDRAIDTSNRDKSEKIADPQDYYFKPQNVLSDSELSAPEKLTLLQNWEDSLVQTQVASGENMPADGAAADAEASEDLRNIREARAMLGMHPSA